MKKLRLILSMVCFLVLGLATFQANAQLRKREVPPSFSVMEAQALPAQAYVKMPINFSVTEWLKEDEFSYTNGIRRARFARDIKADITMENSGIWTELPDGRKVWRVAIEAANAKALLLRYEDFYLPSGAKLFLYSADKTHVLKYYDNSSNPSGGKYSTELVAGDVTVLEYIAPEVETGDKPRIKIEGVGYGYNFIKIERQSDYVTQAAGESASCEVNVICSEGDAWKDQSKSVCAIYAYLMGGIYEMCSGTLVNNTRNDGKPYIMSAWHCYAAEAIGVSVSDSDFLQWQFKFFFESTTCVGNTDYDANAVTFTGCYLRSNSPLSGGSDGVLFELRTPITQSLIDERRISFAGWDRREQMSTSGVGIHHPALDVKKISTFSASPTVSGPINYGLSAPTADGAQMILQWVQTANGWGETEGGSSGSGLFNQDGRLIGTLSGGPNAAECSGGPSKTGNYGRLWYHWDKYGSGAANQFKYWLDPDNTGVEVLDAFPNEMAAAFTGTPTSIYALETVQFNSVVNRVDSIRWEFEGGNPATSTERNPVVEYLTAGVFDAKLTAYGKAMSGNDSIITALKNDYITVAVKGTPAVPVANVYVSSETQTGGGFYDNATEPPTTVSDVPSTNPTYLLENTGAFGSGNGWKRTNGVGGMYVQAGPGFDGAGDYFYSCYIPNRTATTRMYTRIPVDVSTSTNKSVRFQLKNSNWVGDINTLQVQYRIGTSGAWTTIYTHITATGTGNNPPWQFVSVALPDSVENATALQIAFNVIGDWSYGTAIDNIQIGDDPVYEPLPHVVIWEGETVDYVDGSTGFPVLYKYEFEGGNPAESTDTAPKIRVQYAVANTTNYTGTNPDAYDVKQWVKNTMGEDDTINTGYVTVIGRKLETDIDTIISDCTEEIDETITLTANRNWTLTAPAWATVTPTSGTVATLGAEETFTITVTVPANTSYRGNAGIIEIKTDDAMVTKSIVINQSGGSPYNLTVTRYDSVNAKIQWNRPLGMPEPPIPPNPCLIESNSGGFEDATKFANLWTVINGPENTSTLVWQPIANTLFVPRSGSFLAGSRSWVGTAYMSDTYMITPKLQITEDRHTLTYWEWSPEGAGGFGDDYELLLAQTASTPAIADFTVTLLSLHEAADPWAEITVDLSAYIGQEVYIAFHHYQNDGSALAIDDVSGLLLADCDSTASSTGSYYSSPANAIQQVTPNASYRKSDIMEAGNVEKYEAKMQEVRSTNASRLNSGNTPNQNAQLQNNQLQAIDVSTLDAIKWCGDLDPANGVGASGTSFYAAAFWPASEAANYAGMSLAAVEVGITEPNANVTLIVYEGDVLLHSQPLASYNVDAPTVVELSSPITISGAADLYIGYIIAAGYSGWPGGVDAGPVVSGRGAKVKFSESEPWTNLVDQSASLNYNWYIIGYLQSGGYNLYRQRSIDGVPTEEPQLIAEGLSDSDTVYNDVDIRPGGEYCYWVTYNAGAESCPSDTSCVFILYQQEIAPIEDIIKEYGAPAFILDKAGTDYLLESSADDIDYFSGRTVPVTLEIIDGISVGLSGLPSDYTATITSAGTGVTNFRAVQTGIADTLLAADTVYFSITTRKKDLHVRTSDDERMEGRPNPTFALEYYDGFVYEETAANLDVLPTVTSAATVISPVGQYPITVNVGEDKNYNLIPENAILTVTKSDVIANAFTPHEVDGYNDQFMPGRKIQVFNRYGVLIYDSRTLDEINGGWNGYNRKTGKLVDPGVYYYVEIDQINGKVVRTGSVTVMKN